MASANANFVRVDDLWGRNVIVHYNLQRFYRFTLGGIGTSHADLQGRRLAVPLYFILNVLLSTGILKGEKFHVYDAVLFSFCVLGLVIYAFAYALMIYGLLAVRLEVEPPSERQAPPKSRDSGREDAPSAGDPTLDA